MNKYIKAIAALCIICILAVSVPVTFAANEDGNDDHLLYGRKQLQKSSESNRLTDAYDRIVEGIENREESIVLEDLSLTREELLLVIDLYRNDPHPHFWFGNSYSYSSFTDGIIYAFKPGYNALGMLDDKEFKKEVATFNSEIDSIIKKANIKSNMSQYEIALSIHDVLVQEFDYIKAENAHNAYGAIVEKEAVCQGYTLAYNYILRLLGIEAHYVAGTSRDIPHAWSLVRIDGHYYYTDITWDDPSGTYEGCNEIFHVYFNLTYDEISKDHTFNTISYELPDCSSTEDYYFTHNPERIMTSNPDVSLVASFFNHGSAAVYVPEENVDGFLNWYSSNIIELASLAGFDTSERVSYLYTNMNNEYHLIIVGTRTAPDVLLGDVDGDGKITSMDSNLLKRIIAGSMTPTEMNTAGGDIDGDGRLTSIDSNLLKRLIAGNN